MMLSLGSVRLRAAWGAVAVAGILAVGARWIEQWRPHSPERLAPFALRVTTSADSGAGSLREAILAADRLAARARIVVAVPRVAVETPLPPLINPFGMVLEAESGGADLEASEAVRVVLDIVSPGAALSNLRIRGGRAGVLIRARGAMLRNVSVTDSDTGVLIADGGSDASVTESAFVRNRIGIQVSVVDKGKTTVWHSRFEEHGTAAVWAVAPPTATSAGSEVVIQDSHFRGDTAGVVIVNMSARIERNVFDDQKGSAVYASDTRIAFDNNRIRSGRGFGLFVERLSSSLVSGNEIARNCAGGVMMRRVTNTRLIGNQIYQNGYGMVLMQGMPLSPNTVADNLIVDQVGDGIVLIGTSPVLTGNRVFRNHLAGLRLSSMGGVPDPVLSAPLLSANTFQGNGRDEPQRDEYDPRSATTPANQPLNDCSWRVGPSVVLAAQAGTGR